MTFIKFTKAFTLIELLIVIVIIGILASTLLPKVKGMQDKAKYVKVDKDFQDFRTVAFMAQSTTNNLLSNITLSKRTAGGCWLNNGWMSDIRNLPVSHPCRTQRVSALQKISVAAGMDTGSLSSLELDPWGSPYVFDENDGDFGNDGCLYQDGILSAGPDGSIVMSGDNRKIHIRPALCIGGY